ncbi:MAG: PAS domain S-box protein [Acidobacteriota bacterium]|nr:PAS domain S-box protein [Acidobacteriota bacterium]
MTNLRPIPRWAGAHLQALGLSFLFIVFAAAVLWFFATFVPDRRQVAIDGWRQELSMRADLTRDLLERRLLDAKQDLTFVAAFPSVRGLMAPGLSEEAAGAQAAHLEGILSDYRRNYRLRSVSIVDPSGRVRASGGGPVPGTAALALAADVIRSGAPGVALVREPDGAVGLLSMVPVAGDAAGSGPRQTLGAMLAVVDASTSLFDPLRQPGPTASSESFLVRLEGNDILFLSPLRFRPDPPLSFRLPRTNTDLAARAAVTERESFQAFVDYRGVRVLAAVRRLEGAPWGLVVKVDESEALAAFRKEMLEKAVTWGFLFLALLGAVFAFWYAFLAAQEMKLARSEAAESRIRKLNRLLRTISEVNQLLVRATDEEALLKDVCKILVSHGGYALAWIGRADRETMRVVPVASAGDEAGDEAGYLQRIDVRWDDTPEGRGPLGIAIREGRAMVVSDVQIDPLVGSWRGLMLLHGFKSLAVIPVRRGGLVTAGLAVYAAEKAIIDEEELALLEGLGGDLSFALDALDARAAVRLGGVELRKLGRAVEQSPASVLITDLEGRIEYVNPHFTKATGYTAEEALGQNPRILKSDRTPPEVHRVMWQTLAAGGVWQGELCNKRKDGSLFWEYASISPVRDEHGVTTSYVAVKEDISDRKRSGEALAKSEAYFRSLIESGFDLTAVLDPDGGLRYVSPSVERILGYKSKELVGRSIFEFIHEEDREKAAVRLRQAVVEGIHETIVVRFRHKDGSTRTLSAIGNNLPAETGMTGLVINARDISDRLQLEVQLQQAQKMEAVGRLAGGVAHDFNNLLTVIQGYGELLTASLAGDSQERESVAEIVKAAERAAALTRQLLAFSRKQVLEMRVLDLGAIVANMNKMLKRLIGEDVEVVIVTPAALGRVKADAGQVEQVVLNLAVNARDAMPGGGRLTIELADADLPSPVAAAQDMIPPGPYVVLSIADTGSGIDAETLDHIFEPFFTTKEKGKGTGLGLATVYGIVRQTGGYVRVETAPGAGTRFRIYLPRCAEHMTTSGIRSSVSPRHGTETVLLVEDEPAVRAIARVILERHGYTVVVAESGEAALDVLAREPRVIHVLLTDLVMPGMNGRELASCVLALRPAIKVVFMSGYAADVVTSVDESGAAGFLPKPFTERALTAKIREVIDTPSA